MLNEVIKYLNPKRGEKFIDCTLGDGGHTIEILKLGGHVLGMDYSEESLARAKERINNLELSKNFIGAKGNFKDLEEITKQNNFSDVSGIIFDLGYSSFQLDNLDLGISFNRNDPLDMRIDKTLGVSALDLINMLSEKQLQQLISSYGGERYSKKFAEAIIKNRDLKKLHTTKDLADLLKSVSPLGYEKGRIHPATRTFQALRIAVNNELENLQLALPQAARVLLPGGRMLVISFHSLEDKIVKKFGLSAQPNLSAVNRKPLMPTDEEVSNNSRARSAKLRIYERYI